MSKNNKWSRFYTITEAANSAAHHGFGRMGGGFYNTGEGHIAKKESTPNQSVLVANIQL